MVTFVPRTSMHGTLSQPDIATIVKEKIISTHALDFFVINQNSFYHFVKHHLRILIRAENKKLIN